MSVLCLVYVYGDVEYLNKNLTNKMSEVIIKLEEKNNYFNSKIIIQHNYENILCTNNNLFINNQSFEPYYIVDYTNVGFSIMLIEESSHPLGDYKFFFKKVQNQYFLYRIRKSYRDYTLGNQSYQFEIRTFYKEVNYQKYNICGINLFTEDGLLKDEFNPLIISLELFDKEFFKKINSFKNDNQKFKKYFSLKIIKMYLESLPIYKKTLSPYNNIAYYLQKAGANEEAVYLLEKILKKYPKRTVAHYNLADAYWALGEKKKAIASYTTYIEQMCNAGKEKRIPQVVRDRVSNK